jgi:hypothetical protein
VNQRFIERWRENYSEQEKLHEEEYSLRTAGDIR